MLSQIHRVYLEEVSTNKKSTRFLSEGTTVSLLAKSEDERPKC